MASKRIHNACKRLTNNAKRAFLASHVPLIVAYCVTAFSGCVEQPMAVQPATIDFRVTDEHRAALSDDVRKMLELMEDGNLAGANTTKFQSTLDQATKINQLKKTTRYLFAADGHQGELEGHPVIYVIV